MEIGDLTVKQISPLKSFSTRKIWVAGYLSNPNVSQYDMTWVAMMLIWESVWVLSDKFGHFVICLASGNQAGAQFDSSNFLRGQFFFQSPPQMGPIIVFSRRRHQRRFSVIWLHFKATSNDLLLLITIILLWDKNHFCCYEYDFDCSWLFSWSA